jgi:CRP/FNR family cyclic AMP-dependent transcriptional regulator
LNSTFATESGRIATGRHKNPVAKDQRTRRTFDPKRVLTGRGAGQSRLQFAPGRVIRRHGDPADSVFYIEKGRVKLTLVSASGKEAVVSVRGEGEFVGTRALIARRRAFSATALTECSLVRATPAAIIRLLREEPDFAEMFVLNLVGQRIRDQRNIFDLLTNSSERRLARTLLQLADIRHNGKSGPIPTRINQAILAGMIGTTRSRVSSFMNKFRKQGFIEYNRRGDVTVHRALSKALHDV